jgi:hypothetical protein
LSLLGLPLNRYVIYQNVTINASQTTSFGSSGLAVTVIDATAAAPVTRLEILVHLPDQAILRKGKPAKHDATEKWAHALESKFPELTNKSDAELSATIRHMRER